MQQLTMTDRKVTILLHVMFWLVLGVLNFALSNWWFLEEKLNIWRPLMNHLVLILLFYANVWPVNHLLEKKKYLSYFLVVNVLVWASVPFRFFINRQYIVEVSGLEGSNLDRGLLFVAMITGFGIVMLSTIYHILINRYAAERKALAIINKKTEAELQFLRAQINPHFLFNTLNNIYSLAVVRSAKTAQMVLKLSHLLRYVVYSRGGELVPLAMEVEHIRHFIELFQMRNEEPQDINFSVKGDFSEVQIEPMILIPIVENCFKHCDFGNNPKAFVRIELTVQDGVLNFMTINTKDDYDRQKDHTGGVGLENILRRLDLQYPKNFQMEINDGQNLFKVFLTLNLKVCNS